MRPRYKIEISINYKLISNNRIKVVNEKSKWNGGVNKIRKLIIWLYLWPNHYNYFFFKM